MHKKARPKPGFYFWRTSPVDCSTHRRRRSSGLRARGERPCRRRVQRGLCCRGRLGGLLRSFLRSLFLGRSLFRGFLRDFFGRFLGGFLRCCFLRRRLFRCLLRRLLGRSLLSCGFLRRSFLRCGFFRRSFFRSGFFRRSFLFRSCHVNLLDQVAKSTEPLDTSQRFTAFGLQVPPIGTVCPRSMNGGATRSFVLVSTNRSCCVS